MAISRGHQLLACVFLFAAARWAEAAGASTAVNLGKRSCGSPNLVTTTSQRVSRYYEMKDSIQGGMIANISHSLAHRINLFQRKSCIQGSVAEIGVHHGEYFFSFAVVAADDEQKLAIDIFEDQRLNIDGSGHGSLQAFLEHGKQLGVSNIRYIQGDSQQVTAADIRNMDIPPVRFFSVDGAHHKAATVSDLRLAASVLHPDGVIVVDDITNWHWMGVLDGTMDWLMHEGSDFAPFMLYCNKLYIARKSSHATYYNLVKSLDCIDCTANHPGMHPTRFTMFGKPMCVQYGGECYNVPRVCKSRSGSSQVSAT
mmetsp:Transcript_24021/g.52544  ORF Transcript_24021/g.52544 Transcript_24021/m.52544 type:complete len:312 (+) Transcript_24021:71-1006(+)